MKAETRDQIVKTIVSSYLESSHFNGYPISGVTSKFELSDSETTEVLRDLISDGSIDVMFGNVHPNPHIKAFSGIPIDKQLEYLQHCESYDHVCVYPKRPLLDGRPELRRYEGAPYSMELALGEGQLNFRAFDLSVLEHYRNDPRYVYDTNWISGFISVKDEHFESASMPEHDQVLLQTFGIAYDDELNRAVAVFLRYLHDLSPEHQQIWYAKELGSGYKLHPDYYRSSLLGEFGQKISVFEAFIQELEVINAMAELMGRPPLFRNTFRKATPREFGFLLRPTQGEYNRFVQLLDKMLSDNLSKEFFRNDIPLEHEETRADGKVEVRTAGTIQLLERWTTQYFRPRDPEPVKEMLATFRKVRKLRQKPAHAVDQDRFDQQYFKGQRQLILDAYDAIRTLRLILVNHPDVRANPPHIGEHLREGKIWDI